ncbi:MAG: hypothetical protein ACJAS9_000167 [Polaribacter sp.]|jgi:hypothetical protein
MKFFFLPLTLIIFCQPIVADVSLLPPIDDWHGKSEHLIQSSSNPWQTPSEKLNLISTPNYKETFKYLDKLVASDQRLNKISIGKSPQGRDIWMVIASSDGISTSTELRNNGKPTLLVQAGIHSGEIDGKDAGLMLLRDIIYGGKEKLLEKVNWLFVPILSVDGHEKISAFNRVNQRGPTNMGWRTSAENLNLNRDYTKLETLELKALIKTINEWKPDLYYDVHVTDGEDYQYDITYGFNTSYGASPSISKWLSENLKPQIDTTLETNGHLGGPLTFGIDSMDFSKGIVGWTASPRFSNGYGDYRHLATVLVENHSLKPYKQRVLGTYIFIEETLKILAEKGQGLIKATKKDNSRKVDELIVSWDMNQENPTSMDFMGIDYRQKTDPLTGLKYIDWLGTNKLYIDLPIVWMNKAKDTVSIPQSYWIPAQYYTVIEKLKSHGIEMVLHKEKKVIKGNQLCVEDFEFAAVPFEGRQMPKASFSETSNKFVLPEYSVEVKTNQPLGHLAVALLDPRATDSFFAWGYFNSIFQRTEYIESYVLIPLAKKLFAENPKLKNIFEKRKQDDKEFAKDSTKQMEWIYQQSKYYDQEYLKYPVIFEF